MWALAKSPDHPLALEHLGEPDECEGKLDAAEAGYRRLLEMRGDDAQIKSSLSKLLERRGARAEADGLALLHQFRCAQIREKQ